MEKVELDIYLETHFTPITATTSNTVITPYPTEFFFTQVTRSPIKFVLCFLRAVFYMSFQL